MVNQHTVGGVTLFRQSLPVPPTTLREPIRLAPNEVTAWITNPLTDGVANELEGT